MSKNLVGIADLLTLFSELPEAQAHVLAASLGYRLAPQAPQKEKAVERPISNQTPESVKQTRPVEVPAAALESAGFWRASQLSLADAAAQTLPIPTRDQVVWRCLLETLPRYRYLFDWPQLRRRLEPQLRLLRQLRRPDTPEIGRRLARAETIRRPPRQWHERLCPTLIILHDRSTRLQPYLQDYALLRNHLHKIWPPQLIQEYAIQDDLKALRPLNQPARQR